MRGQESGIANFVLAADGLSAAGVVQFCWHWGTDQQRYLNDEPVQACPPSAWYRLRKFARRNKAVLTTALLVAAALLIGAALTTWQAIRATRALQAERETRRTLDAAHLDEDRQRSRTNRELSDALVESAMLREQTHKAGASDTVFWTKLQETGRRAEHLASSGLADAPLVQRVRGLLADLQIEAEDRKLIAQLEAIGFEIRVDKRADWRRVDTAYAAVFAAVGVDIDTMRAEDAAQRLRVRPLRDGFVLALDHWARARRLVDPPDPAHWPRPLAVARLTDADDFRNRVRSAWAAWDIAALKKIADAVEIDRVPPSTILIVGETLAYKHDSDERLELAIRLLKRAQLRYPEHSGINLQLGAYLRWLKQPRLDEALRYCWAGVATRPQHALAWAELGLLQSQKGQLDESIASYSKAIELDPTFARAWCNRAVIHSLLRNFDRAIADSSVAIDLDPQMANPQMANPWINRGASHLALNQPAEALADLSVAIRLDPNNARIWCNRGVAYLQMGQVDKAFADYAKAIELEPNQATTFNNRGIAHKKLGQLDSAIADYSKAIELEPTRSLYWNQRATSRKQLGQWALAAADFSQVLKLEARNAVARLELARCNTKLGRFQEALDDYDTIIRSAPQVALPYNEVAWILATGPDAKHRDPVRAIELAKQAVKLAPQDEGFWNTLGVAQYRSSHWNESLAALQKSIEFRKGGDAYDWLFLAMAHWQLHRKEEASQWYGRSLAWMDSNQEAIQKCFGWEELSRFRAEAEDLLQIKPHEP